MSIRLTRLFFIVVFILPLVSCNASHANLSSVSAQGLVAPSSMPTVPIVATIEQTPTPTEQTAIHITPTPQSTATTPVQETYCLWPGDTLYGVAANAQVDIESLQSLNSNFTGFAGSTLQLPSGSVPPTQWESKPTVINSIEQIPFGVSGYYMGYDNHTKKVALTFDIGYEPEDEQLIKMLAERHIRATFFVVGRSVAHHPELIAALLNNKHELGNHSWDHQNMQDLSEEEITAELANTEAAVEQAYPGATTRPFFRAPYGALSSTLISTAKQEGYYSIGWTIDSHDWMEGISADEVYQHVTESMCPGAIIALHDVNSANKTALPKIIDFLETHQYEIVPLSELLIPK